MDNQKQYFDEQEIDLVELLAKLWKRKWSIISLCIFFISMTIPFVSLDKKPLYLSKTIIKNYSTSYYEKITYILESNTFIEKIKTKFPHIELENFSWNDDDNSSMLEIRVTSDSQNEVAEVNSFSITVVDEIFASLFEEEIEEKKEKNETMTLAINTYKKNISSADKQSSINQSTDQKDYQLPLQTKNVASLDNILEYDFFDISKVNVLEKAKRPNFSIAELEEKKGLIEENLRVKKTSTKLVFILIIVVSIFTSIFLIFTFDFIKANKDKFKEKINE